MKTQLKSESLEFIPLEAGLEIDTDSKTLFGVQVAMLGTAKGHNFELDETTLDQIVALGNAAPKGVKARFGHPTECTPALGTFLGTRTNFRRDGKYVRADLHLSEAARPEYAKHVLDMAKHHPEKVGNSVVISGQQEYLRDESGQRLRNDQGEERLPVLRVKHLHAVDVVDEPAAGDGMFSEPIAGVELSPKTIVELRKALGVPGFVERSLNVLLGRRDSPEAEATKDADHEVSETEDSMSLTLKDFKEQYPEVAQEFAAELSAGHEEAVSAALEKGADQERTRIQKFLSKCEPHNFEPEKDMPRGYALHVIEKNLSYDDALEGLLDRKGKRSELSALEEASSDIPVESADTPAAELSAKEVVSRNLMAAVERHNQKGGA